MKFKYILILITLATLITTFFVYKNFIKPVKSVEIKDSTVSQWVNDQKKTYSEGKEWYNVKVEYPENNKFVKDVVFQKMSDFLYENELKKYNNLKEANEGLSINAPEQSFYFEAVYKIATSTDTITYVYTVSTYTGGAHGSVVILPVTLNTKGEKMDLEKILPLSVVSKNLKIFKDSVWESKQMKYKEANMSLKEIAEIKKDTAIIDEGTKPNRDNYSAVWPEGENIRIVFQQYQVGPYAEGIYEISVPKSILIE